MVSMLLEILLLIIIVTIGFYFYFGYGKYREMLNKLPGPPAIPVFGNSLLFLSHKMENLLPIMHEINKKYYPVYRLCGLGWSEVVVLNPEDAEIVLSSSKYLEKSLFYKSIQPWLADGLLLSKGAKWHNRRKILTSAFHFHVLQKYQDILIEHSIKLVDSLGTDGKEQTIELVPFLTYYTLSAICETAMGTSLNDLNSDEIEKYRKAVFYMGEVTFYRILRPWLLNDFIFEKFTSLGRKQRETVKTLHAFSRKIIKSRTEFHKNTDGKFLKEFLPVDENDQDENIDIVKANKKRLAMLDLLIAASWNGLIDEQGIAEEVDTFIFEGHDTSAMALVFIIQLLAEYEDVQERIRSEIREIWPSQGRKIDMSVFNKLTYLECCIKESLRLFPSVPFISRIINEDLQIKNYTIPAKTIIHIFINEIHRDSNYWPEPDTFNPDRFLPEKIIKRHPFSYIPFSGGPRNCIGQKFAMMELKIFTAYIIKNFKLKALLKHSEIKQLPDLVFRPIQKIKVTFIPIEN